MKILLINPVIIKRDFNWVSNLEPLGLEYLAAMLLPEHEVEILDGLPAGLSYDEILNTIKNFQPQVIGISVGYSIGIKTAKDVADLIKKSFPDILIVLGGNAATFTAEYLLKHPSIDIIVLGEGEITFKELIEKWEVGSGKWELLTGIPGLCYKTSDGKIKFTPKRALIDNLDVLPFPVHSILKNKIQYERTVLAGRGCPHNCIYCSTAAFFKKHRKRSVESIIKEIEYLFNPDLSYGTNRVVFIDDNFTVDKNRIKNLADKLLNLKEKLNLADKILWEGTGHIEHITEDLLITMKTSGCTGIFFGIESGSEKMLKFLKRKYTPDDVIKVTTLCKKTGIQPITLFMVGLPYETKEDMEQTFSLIEKVPGNTGINIFTAFPGTPVFNNPKKYGLTILPHLPEEDNLNQNSYVCNEYYNTDEIMKAYYKALGLCIRKGKKFAWR